MKEKKINIKKILYITLIVILSIVFVASLTFGAIAAFANEARESIEVWYSSTFEKDISLLKQSIIWLLVSATLFVFTFSFKEFKKKYID